MSYVGINLHQLAARARTGDAGAAVALRRELEPHMLHIVRRAMRSTTGPSAVTRRVWEALNRLSGGSADQPGTDSERLLHRVADDICASLLGRLQAEQPRHRPLCETVRN